MLQKFYNWYICAIDLSIKIVHNIIVFVVSGLLEDGLGHWIQNIRSEKYFRMLHVSSPVCFNYTHCKQFMMKCCYL